MASSIITRINFALDDVELLVKTIGSRWIMMLRIKLRNLKTFVLCARMLSKDEHLRINTSNNNRDGSLVSLLVRVEDAVDRNSRKIKPYCHGFCGLPWVLEEKVGNFLHDTQSFEDEADEWYSTILDYTGHSTSLSANEIVEITDSILEFIEDFLSLRLTDFCIEMLVEEMESLSEQMAFLKNFIRFATQGMKDLLAHTEAVAINTSHLLFSCRVNEFDEEWCKGMLIKISMLLENIKPIDRRVYETYTEALRSSKLSTRLHATTQDMDDAAIIVMKNFLDSLISNLWRMLQLDTCRLVSMKDQLQTLDEGLRFLRNGLKQQLNNFDGKTRDHIGVVVYDVNEIQVEVDLGVQDLLERIEVIVAEVAEEAPQTSVSILLEKERHVVRLSDYDESRTKAKSDRGSSITESQALKKNPPTNVVTVRKPPKRKAIDGLQVLKSKTRLESSSIPTY